MPHDNMTGTQHTSTARILNAADPEWPTDLGGDVSQLWVDGPASLAQAYPRSIAIVGARAATSYGMQVAHELAHGLAQQGFVIVSGASHGIATAAHRGALAANGTTIAVMPCGIDVAYPVANTGLLDQISNTGAVITPFEPGSRPSKHRFLQRNRLLARIADCVLVVEAGKRSGSLATALTAHELGVPVGAVPGPVTSVTSAGTHQLIRDGYATLVTSVENCVELFGRQKRR